MSVTFHKYHLDHHRFQGVDGIDVDLPAESEGFWVEDARGDVSALLLRPATPFRQSEASRPVGSFKVCGPAHI